MLAQTLVASSGILVLSMGSGHLFGTFLTPLFDARDPELQARMRQVSPRISPRTTMWDAWIGFNASHSLGAMLFGLVYAYLALFHFELLAGSLFLAGLGLAFLASMLVVGAFYWFRVPITGLVIATTLYIAGFALAPG
jgi:hypothetical protein